MKKCIVGDSGGVQIRAEYVTAVQKAGKFSVGEHVHLILRHEFNVTDRGEFVVIGADPRDGWDVEKGRVFVQDAEGRCAMTVEDILREMREDVADALPASWCLHREEVLELADRLEEAHKAALVEKAKADARAWSPLIDAAERREAAAVAMYGRLKAAAQVYIAATAPLMGANSERIINARAAVEAAMKGAGNER